MKLASAPRLARNTFVRNRRTAPVLNVRQEIVFNLRPSKNLVRNETLEGRKYIVVPMVMMTEGVHRGSNGSLYYPGEELGKTPCIWNMKPIVVNHPEANGVGMSACDPDVAEKYKIGLIMNTEYDELGRLKSEAWLEPHRADEVDPRIMEAVRNQTMMELSTGVFVDKDYQPGEFEGESYEAIARNYRPDHLAVLPDKKGACAIEDGAGFIRNRADESPELLDAVLTYNAKKPTSSKDEPSGDPAHEASKKANRTGAWAVISGTKKGHDAATAAHEKAARLYTKAGNKAFADWHNQKASDHKNWGDEAEDGAAQDKPTGNEFEDGNGGTDANANDDEGVPVKAEESDAATAQATERSNKAMTSAQARLHKNAAIAHRYAASAQRRANKGQDNVQSKYHMNAAKLHDSMVKNSEDVTENELSFDDIRMQLSKILREGNQNCPCWVVDVFETSFVYDDGSGKLFTQDYTIGDSDKAEFEGEPVAVVRKTSYEPATNKARKGTTNNNNNMKKKQLIDSLISNHGWEESDRKYLVGLPEPRLLTLHKQAEALAVKNTQVAKDHANVSDSDEDSDAADNQDDDRGSDNGGTSEDTIKKGGKEATVGKTTMNKAAKAPVKRLTMNEFMQTAPEEVQEVVREAQQMVANEREKLVESITANEHNEYTEAELKSMPMAHLRKLAKMAGVGTTENVLDQAARRPSYFGQGDAAPLKNEEGSVETEVLLAPVMNFAEESA